MLLLALRRRVGVVDVDEQGRRTAPVRKARLDLVAQQRRGHVRHARAHRLLPGAIERRPSRLWLRLRLLTSKHRPCACPRARLLATPLLGTYGRARVALVRHVRRPDTRSGGRKELTVDAMRFLQQAMRCD